MSRQPVVERARSNGRLIAAAVLAALVIVFIFENTAKTRIRFIIPRFTTPLWVALFVAFLVGALVGALIARPNKPRK